MILLGVELLDPVGEERRARDVVEDAGAGGRNVRRAVLGLQEEDRHLVALHGLFGAELAGRRIPR